MLYSSFPGVFPPELSQTIVTNCVIIGCDGFRLMSTTTSINSGTGNGLYSLLNSIINNRSEYCTIFGSSNSSISDNSEYNSIYSTSDSLISGGRTNNSIILGAVNSTGRFAVMGTLQLCNVQHPTSNLEVSLLKQL